MKLTESATNEMNELLSKGDEFSKIGQHYQDKMHFYQKENACLSVLLFFLLFAASFTYYQVISPEIYNMY